MEEKYSVYIKLDSQNKVIEINSSAFLSDFTGWIKVDEGVGDKYHHAQGNYLEDSLIDILGSYNYKFEENKIILRTEAEKQADIINIPKPVSEIDKLQAQIDDILISLVGGAV